MEAFLEFCRETSIHGLKQAVSKIETQGLTKKQTIIRTVFIRLLWIIVVILGLVFAVWLMLLIWTRFKTTPTITTVWPKRKFIK